MVCGLIKMMAFLLFPIRCIARVSIWALSKKTGIPRIDVRVKMLVILFSPSTQHSDLDSQCASACRHRQLMTRSPMLIFLCHRCMQHESLDPHSVRVNMETQGRWHGLQYRRPNIVWGSAVAQKADKCWCTSGGWHWKEPKILVEAVWNPINVSIFGRQCSAHMCGSRNALLALMRHFITICRAK